MGERRLRDEDDDGMLDWDSPAEQATDAAPSDDDGMLDWDSTPDDGPISVEIGDAVIRDPDAPAPEDPREDQHSYMDGLLAYGDGLLGHWGGEAANALTRGAEYLSPEGLTGMGEGDPEQAERIVDRAARNSPYASGAGQATLGIGAGMLAGPGIAAQALTGAGVAGGSEYGDSHDPLRAGGKALAGGAISGGAAALGAGAARLMSKGAPAVDDAAQAMPPGARRIEPLPGSRPYPKGVDTSDLPTEGMAPTPKLPPAPMTDPAEAKSLGAFGDQIVQQAMKRMPGRNMLRAGDAIAGKMMSGGAPNEGARWSTINGVEGASELLGSMYRDAKNRLFGGADETRAPASKRVVDWALKSVLTSPAVGLDQNDAAKLHQTMSSGDAQGTASLLYTLGQKNPAFKKAYEQALKRANGDNE